MEEKNNIGNEAEEKKMEDLLQESAKDTEIPDSLLPGEIEKKILERERIRKKRRRRHILSGTVAAGLCLVAGISGYFLITDHTGDMRSGTSEQSVSASSEAANPDGSGTDESSVTAGISETDLLATAEDYDEIYEYIQAEREYWEDAASATEESTADSSTGSAEARSFDSAGANAESISNTASGKEYSDTNVREEGVGEGDIVKTDGKNLYVVNGEKINIVGAGSTEMELLAQIEPEEGSYPSEVYAQDGYLAVVYTKSEYSDGTNGYDGYYRDYTCADVYDVSNPEEPEKIGGITQSGYFNTMRIRGGYVYLLSSFYADTGAARGNQPAYIPEVQGKLISTDCIYMPQGRMGNSYTVISSFDLDDPEGHTDSKAVFGNTGICYVSTENIYITESIYGESDSDVNQTSIRKVSYGEGILEGAGQTKLSGVLNDSFSIDEYDGYLRLVTTVTKTEGQTRGIVPLLAPEPSESNSLYVLDENLKIVGEIRDLAEGESVYSARFMGKTGYFVTFRQVDPLFSVDLSDPAAPKILGELKIPGFSEYLHPYGDGLLLGIGMDVDESGVATEGVKLSMFDISDPSDVREVQKYVIEDMYGTDVYDYRSVFADVEKNLFGFTAYGSGQKYYIFSYDENKGFRQEFERTLGGYGSTRGLYIGDRFYLVSGNTIEAYALDGFEKVGDLVL
ncbi:MAG TPA: beta-propeller domain-containing protein [Candidatus Mediterraneibacter excrementigallinarum]|nr:beta-propeller domain-containing protein [Candidatus Mediterraneibacter excrementigallinarum]